MRPKASCVKDTACRLRFTCYHLNPLSKSAKWAILHFSHPKMADKSANMVFLHFSLNYGYAKGVVETIGADILPSTVEG